VSKEFEFDVNLVDSKIGRRSLRINTNQKSKSRAAKKQSISEKPGDKPRKTWGGAVLPFGTNSKSLALRIKL
jgi:hypothetical protein